MAMNLVGGPLCWRPDAVGWRRWMGVDLMKANGERRSKRRGGGREKRKVVGLVPMEFNYVG
jgi:hypothetical protein